MKLVMTADLLIVGFAGYPNLVGLSGIWSDIRFLVSGKGQFQIG